MTILATGADLATEVAAALNRSDLTARIPTYIVRAEAKINRLLRGNEMLNQAFSITGEYVGIPADMYEVRSFRLNTSPIQTLSFKPNDALDVYTTPGQPKFFAVVGGKFRFGPVPDATYTATLLYKSTVTSLSGVNTTTNSVLLTHPDLYLYGTLLESAGDYRDNENLSTWATAYQAVVTQIQKSENRYFWGGNNMQVRPA